MSTRPLENKVALITGASRGIGRATALRLAEQGTAIAVNYVRNEEAARSVCSELTRLNVKALPFQANVGDTKAVQELVEAVTKQMGPIDILIHNAALGAFKPVHQLRPNQWDLSFEVNTKALLLLTQLVLPGMEKKKEGIIIALSSLGGQRYIPSYGAIGVSKAALEMLVKYLAAELGAKGIRVNCVSGGAVETDALKSFPDYAALKQQVIEKTPSGRLGQPDDLARVVAFLALPESRWIHGQVLIADGGLSLF